jgi:hypothetical protein
MILHPQSSPSLRRHLWASIVSIACFLRGFPLFFRATPRTPLRVLCLIAFDVMHVLRTSRPLSRHRVRVLSMLLDRAACTNATLDHKKRRCPQTYAAPPQWIKHSGAAFLTEEYLRRIRELERRRPSPGGDHRRFDEVRSYRESVIRLSLGAVAAIALGEECVEDGIREIYSDHDLATLFRIVMLCQIIDDALDYSEDLSAGLPTFLTAAAPLPQGLARTAKAAHRYTKCNQCPRSADLLPFRLALLVLAIAAKLLLRTIHWRHRIRMAQQPATRLSHQQPGSSRPSAKPVIEDRGESIRRAL